MFWRMVYALAMLCAGLGATAAQYDRFPDIEWPLYPEVIVPVDDSYSSDADLSAFRRAVGRASDALVKRSDGGEAYDPEAMFPLLADGVELFIGRLRTPFREDFIFIGRQPARTALEIIGRLSRDEDGSDPVIVQQRYGMHVLGRLALEPTVGHSPWLDGRICTASYGKLEWSTWSSLWHKLEFFDKSEWRIATIVRSDHGELAMPDWPRRYQMVPVSPEQKRSGGSIGVISPVGDTVFFTADYDPTAGHFAPYLNDHLCFERQDDKWKISAVAIRLD